jgi:hypothetical protein
MVNEMIHDHLVKITLIMLHVGQRVIMILRSVRENQRNTVWK